MMVDDEDDNDDYASYFDLLENSKDWLSYESWKLDDPAQEGQPPTVRFTYNFCGVRKISCTLELPAESADALREGPTPAIQSALFHVGLVVLAWVWMSFPTTDVRIAAGYLSPEQVEFWEWFYRHTFAEYAAVNNLPEEDVCVKLSVEAKLPLIEDREGSADEVSSTGVHSTKRVLCPLGGGKDSLVACALLAAQLSNINDTNETTSKDFSFEYNANEGNGTEKVSRHSLSWLYVADVIEGVDIFRDGWRLPALVQASGLQCLHLSHDFGYRYLESCRRSYTPCGHPWAALICFDALLVSLLLGFDHVAVGNERSANFGNGVWIGSHEVNHQFDKSYAFESKAHAYIKSHFRIRRRAEDASDFDNDSSLTSYTFGGGTQASALMNELHYFSALQPLWEVQIAWLFARGLSCGGVLCDALRSFQVEPSTGVLGVAPGQMKEEASGEDAGDVSAGHPFITAFISCNESDNKGNWCARCDKCCFVFALLAAWLPPEEVARRIFKGRNLLADQSLLASFRALVAPGGRTPFDCVGTRDEARLSLWLARRRLRCCSEGCASGCVLEDLSTELEGADELLHLLVDPVPTSSPPPPHNLPAWWLWRSQPMPRRCTAAKTSGEENIVGFAWATEIMADAIGDDLSSA